MSPRRKALLFAVVAVALFIAIFLAAREEHTGGLEVRTLWAIYGIVLALLALVLFGRLSGAVRRAALFVLLIVVLYLLLPRLMSGGRALELLREADWRIVGVAVVVEFIALLGYANLFRHILQVVDIRVHLARMYSIVLAGLAASHLFGAGGAAGWVVSYNSLRKQDAPHGLIFVAIAAQNFFNYIVLWLLFLAAMAWGLLTGELDPLRYSVALLLIAFLLWLSGYAIYLYFHRTKMRRRVVQVVAFMNRFRKSRPITAEHIDEWLDHLFSGMRRMSTHRGAKRLALTYSVVFWAFDMLCLYLTFRAFGHHVGFTPLAISYVVAYAVGTLTPTPGGLGAVETLMITMLIGFGVPSAEATIVVLSYRLINFWLPVPPGLVSYAFIR
jgi:uncharacterized protein (TIRG00374 family)